MAAEYLATSRLANVIQLILLGRQTGILRVVRGQGATREVGQIQFVDGQPVAAMLGRLTGAAAMNVLSNWGESYYSFDEAIANDEAALDPREDAFGATPPRDAGRAGGLSGSSWPSYDYRTPPAAQPRAPAGHSAPLPSSAFGWTGGLGTLSGGLGTPGAPPASYPGAPGIPAAPPGPTVGPRAPLPRRTSRVDLGEPLPLDRRERMILLLVDGRRSIADLARLTRRTEDEVYAVLTHLRQLGLVE